jgi:hypothetical protein
MWRSGLEVWVESGNCMLELKIYFNQQMHRIRKARGHLRALEALQVKDMTQDIFK